LQHRFFEYLLYLHERPLKVYFNNLHMKKLVLLLMVLYLAGFCFAGCATRYGRYQPESKEALRTFAGGVLGVLAAGNTGGAIVGAFVADIYNISYVRYEDKKLEDNDEASRKRKDRIREAEKEKLRHQKAEKARPEDQKAEKARPEDQKAEKVRPEDQKAEKARPEDQKAEKVRPEDQKAEKARPEERAKFSIEEFRVSAQTVRSGSPMVAKVQYTIQTPKDEQEIRLTERRIFFAADKRIELDKRDIYRTEGRYISIIKFDLPEDLPKGYCILYTILSDGKRSKTEKTVINII
jgi:hypothetical protein